MDHPPRLYKYRSLEGSSGTNVGRALFDGEHYFGSSQHFNDPFECLPAFVLDGTLAQKTAYFKPMVQSYKVPPDDVDAMAASLASNPNTVDLRLLQDSFKKKMGIFPMFCLSAVADNVLMWSHYASNHSGVCLEFDGDCSVFDEARPVIYSSERIRFNILKDDYTDAGMSILLTKSLDWHYEKEWRLIETDATPGVRAWPPEALIAVILGARISEIDRDRVIGWAQRRGRKIELRQASMSLKKFKVDITNL